MAGESSGTRHCRHCGKEIAAAAVVCVGCGCPPDSGTKYCQHCGSETRPAAEVCLHCGVRLATSPPAFGENLGSGSYTFLTAAPRGRVSQKSRLAAGLLGILLGTLGIHRFYLGYTAVGVVMLLMSTVGIILLLPPLLAFVWGLVEGICILTGSFNTDAEGRVLREGS